MNEVCPLIKYQRKTFSICNSYLQGPRSSIKINVQGQIVSNIFEWEQNRVAGRSQQKII